METRLTKHAKQRMMERGITVEDVKEVISKGTKIREGRGVRCVFRHIHIPCIKVEEVWIVKTVYWEWED
jgi:hypothetical protein